MDYLFYPKVKPIKISILWKSVMKQNFKKKKFFKRKKEDNEVPL